MGFVLVEPLPKLCVQYAPPCIRESKEVMHIIALLGFGVMVQRQRSNC